MSNKPIYFCVYRITNLVLRKHYYGYKSSVKYPSQVLGISYWSSSTDENFIQDQKLNPENYRYKIVKIFDNKEAALALEIKLHNLFDVGKNPNFYNKSKQTSTGFDVTGKTAVKDKDGNTFLVSISDERYITGNLKSVNNGLKKPSRLNMTAAKCAKTGNSIGLIHTSDYRWKTGEIVSTSLGHKQKIKVKDKFGNTKTVYNDDNCIKTGEFIPFARGVKTNRLAAKDLLGNSLGQIDITDKRWESGEIIPAMSVPKTTYSAKTKDGILLGPILLSDPRWKTGEIVGVTKGRKMKTGAESVRAFSIEINGNIYTSCKEASEKLNFKLSRPDISGLLRKDKALFPFQCKNGFIVFSISKLNN